MKRNFIVSSLALALMLATVGAANGQRRRTPAKGRTAATATSRAAVRQVPLPASDVVMFVDVRRLLTEAIPRSLADNPAKLAEINADIEQFKTRTGLDARSFERIAVGTRITNPSASVTKIDHTVVIAHGTFNADVLAAAGRLAAKGRYREEKHGGKTVYVFSLNDQIKLFGLLKLRVSDLAMSVLDDKTLAFGEPEAVRAAIDSSAGRNTVNADLVALAQRNPNAIVGFGGNVPPAATRNLDFGNEEIERNVASIRQFYGSVGTAADGFDMLTVLRTDNASDAKNLGDTLLAVKQLAPLFVGQLSGQKGKFAKNAIDNLKIAMQGTEVQISLAVPQADITTLVQVF